MRRISRDWARRFDACAWPGPAAATSSPGPPHAPGTEPARFGDGRGDAQSSQRHIGSLRLPRCDPTLRPWAPGAVRPSGVAADGAGFALTGSTEAGSPGSDGSAGPIGEQHRQSAGQAHAWRGVAAAQGNIFVTVAVAITALCCCCRIVGSRGHRKNFGMSSQLLERDHAAFESRHLVRQVPVISSGRCQWSECTPCQRILALAGAAIMRGRPSGSLRCLLAFFRTRRHHRVRVRVITLRLSPAGIGAWRHSRTGLPA